MSGPEAGREALEAFRQRVLDDPELQTRLRGLPNPPAFAAQVVAVGGALGYRFTEHDVTQAIWENRLRFLTSQKRILPWMYAP